jgi:diguanylate cyclase (GGDEF)-like protein
MPRKLALLRPRISAQLCLAIVLTVVVVCGLAGVGIKFAGETIAAAHRIHARGLAPIVLLARAEVLLEENRRLIDAAALGGAAAAAQVPPYQANSAELAQLLVGLGYAPSDPLSRRFEVTTAQGGAVLELARAGGGEGTIAAQRYASSNDDLRRRIGLERQQRVDVAEAGLDRLGAKARVQIGWILAGAGIAGVLIGPLGLLVLRRVLKRIGAVGSALARLARNDTSVEIPDLASWDEIGEFARSIAVFKAKSIELLHKKAELERLNLQLDVAINNMPLGLSMFDAQDRLLVCNARYAEMYRLPGELTVPGTVDCAHRDHWNKQGARSQPSDAQATGAEAAATTPMMIELADARVIAVSRQPLKGGGWVALHEDVTERHRQEQEIIHLARHDPLTNLANRALFKEQLQQALQRMARGRGFAVLCLDLDRFKAVNDNLGHPVGDALLKQVSERLLSCVRQGDLVARLGGDEFAIIQASARDPNQTESLARRIVETVGKPYHIDGHRIEISTSIGITLAPRDGAQADLLMKQADLALYRSKASGRDGFAFYQPEMNDMIESRRSLENDLRRALDHDALEVGYQPIVVLDCGRIAGFEALPRWTHPSRGMLAGEDLMLLAEEVGLAVEVAEWTLRRSLAQAAQWSQPVKLAVNIVSLQLRRNLLDLVLQALAASRLPSDRLELEISESVLMQDNQNTLALLHQLRQLGVRIVLDDFGTGYGSLSYLRSFPFDKLKLDRGLIADTARAPDAAALVEAVIGLAAKLGMTTLAAGIESTHQLDWMRAHGATQAQGFFFGAAVAADKIEPMLARGAARQAA